MSKSLVKLIDTALVPASLMVLTKLVSVYVISAIIGASWTIKDVGLTLLSARTAVPLDQLAPISTASDVILFLVMAIGFGWQLIQAVYLHDTHINPRLLAKLADKDLLDLVKGSFELFHGSSVWLIFTWITTLTIWINTATSKTHAIVSLLATAFSIGFTVLLLEDVYREIDTGKRSLGKSHAL